MSAYKTWGVKEVIEVLQKENLQQWKAKFEGKLFLDHYNRTCVLVFFLL